MKMTIKKVDAYQVNLLDSTGDKLMTGKQVQTLIENAIGAEMDSWHLPFLGAREKLALFPKLLDSLGRLAEVDAVYTAFRTAQDED